MYRRLLVPHDGSVFSERALTYAIPIAAKHNASIHVVQVSGLAREVLNDPGAATAVRAVIDDVRTTLRQQMERTVKRLATRDRVQIDAEFRDGQRAVDELLAAASEQNADLIVVATHGRGGLSRLWLGSTTDELLRASTRPLLVVRKARNYTEVKPSDPVFPRMVVALDGTPESISALEAAIALAGDQPVHLVLVRVENWLPAGQSTDWEVESRKRLTDHYLAPLAAQYAAPGRTITTRVEVNANIASTLLEVCRSERAYAIVVATHRRNAAVRAVLGSTADKVIRAADLPVLVAPPKA